MSGQKLNMMARKTSELIDATAADWAVRVDHAPLDPLERSQLEAWLAADVRRLGAYARARAVMAHAHRAKALGAGFDPDGFLVSQARTPSAATPSDDERRNEPPEPGRHMPRRALLTAGTGALAAGILVAAGISWPAAALTYRTRKGEVRLVRLADGSGMTLNTASAARVRFTDGERRVELLEGEALFDVCRNPARPFVVAAGDTRVRALGTSFAVSRLAAEPVRVLVRQGTVEVEGPRSVRLTTRVLANSSATVSEAGPIRVTPVASGEVSRELAWHQGMLSFEDRPLREAASEFARYADTRIGFADPAIGDETVTGLFAANNPAGFARSAALSLGLKARFSADVIILSRPK